MVAPALSAVFNGSLEFDEAMTAFQRQRDEAWVPAARGNVEASRGVASGRVRVTAALGDAGTLQPGEVLVTRMTAPDWVPLMKRAAAIVTDSGGMTCHAAIVSRELDIRLIETVCVTSYQDDETQGKTTIIKAVGADISELGDGGERVLIVDDLVDTGATASLVREMLPKAHFASVYAKPKGRPLVDTFITEVSQDTWIYFPWDLGLSFQPPISGNGA